MPESMRLAKKLQKMVVRIGGRYARMNFCEMQGSMPEWLMGVDCKSTGYAYASSNLARPISQLARVAQW
jgi:hypothetical protein